jgi:hypothetical protein
MSRKNRSLNQNATNSNSAPSFANNCNGVLPLVVINRGQVPACTCQTLGNILSNNIIPTNSTWFPRVETTVFQTTLTINTNVYIRAFINTVVTGLPNYAKAKNIYNLYINNNFITQTSTYPATQNSNIITASIGTTSNGTSTRTLNIVVTAILRPYRTRGGNIASTINTLPGAAPSYLKVYINESAPNST